MIFSIFLIVSSLILISLRLFITILIIICTYLYINVSIKFYFYFFLLKKFYFEKVYIVRTKHLTIYIYSGEKKNKKKIMEKSRQTLIYNLLQSYYYGGVLKMANPMVAGIIGITLGVIMLSNVFIPTVKGTNTTTWTAGEVALWAVLTLGGIIGIVYGVFAVFGLA